MKSDHLPLVSIVIPTYNRAQWIAKTITTSLEQDYQNLEVIVCDDGSTDNSDEIIKQFCNDPRLKYSRNEKNIGMVANFKKVFFELATGEYVTQVGSDDYLINKSFISKAIALTQKYPDVLLVFGKYDTLDNNTGIILKNTSDVYSTEFKKGTDVFLEFPGHKTFGWGGAFMHRKKFEEQEPLKTNIISMDHLANLKLMLQGNVGFINEPVYLFRVHGSQASQNMEAEQFINNFISINEPYHMAVKASLVPLQQLEAWKTELSYQYAKYMSVLLAPNDQNEYQRFMNYVREHFAGGYKKLMEDYKWRIMVFFFRKPTLSLKLFAVFSKAKYNYLSSLIKR